jgi:predicted phage terminase large subunit-like protein
MQNQSNRSDAIKLAHDDLGAYGAAVLPWLEIVPHVRLIVEHLEAVEHGDIDRLVITLPPRHLKSTEGSIAFPGWFLGRHPDRHIILASYAQELASDFGRKVRNLVADPLHQMIFPECVLSGDSAAAHRFSLTAGGGAFFVGAGGSVTGRGADLLIIDDPIKSREEANSSAYRRSLQQWFEQVAYTRLQGHQAIVLIQTRWHQDDLAGWLLREHSSDGWTNLVLPAIAEPGDPLGRREGEALWPERFPVEVLNRIREAIGTSAWVSLYQQRPVAEAGGVFKREWWRVYRDQPECRRIIFSLDCAFKTNQQNDYSVVAVFGETPTGYALLHVTRDRLEFPDLERRVIALAEIWRPNAILVEDAASGQSLIQALQRGTRLPILPVKPQGDKLARANGVSPLVESGRVALPESAPWLSDFLEEVSSFPAAPHDDQVDALSQALAYLRESGPVVDYAFQAQAAAVFRQAAEARAMPLDTPVENRLYANGTRLAAAEDRAEMLARSSGRWKFRGW